MTFYIPAPLREITGGRNKVELELSCPTVTAALNALFEVCPGLRDRILTEQGNVREHINIFIGEENIQFTGGLMSSVLPNSEVSIVPSISGG